MVLVVIDTNKILHHEVFFSKTLFSQLLLTLLILKIVHVDFFTRKLIPLATTPILHTKLYRIW